MQKVTLRNTRATSAAGRYVDLGSNVQAGSADWLIFTGREGGRYCTEIIRLRREQHERHGFRVRQVRRFEFTRSRGGQKLTLASTCSGMVSRLLRDHAKKVVGVDLSSQLVEAFNAEVRLQLVIAEMCADFQRRLRNAASTKRRCTPFSATSSVMPKMNWTASSSTSCSSVVSSLPLSFAWS